MFEKLIKFIFDQVDFFIARQVPSKLGFGHQIDARKKTDPNIRFIHSIIQNSLNPIKIIELASGRGVLAQELIKLPTVESYLACDVDEAGIKVLEKRLSDDDNAHKIKCKVMNCLDNEFTETECFDVVIADKLIHLFSPEEIDKVFQFAGKILKPCGIFIINSASVNNFVYERTVEAGENKLYRKLKDDVYTRLWYNITIPYVFFITLEYIDYVAKQTGFFIVPELVYKNDRDYLTLAVCKNKQHQNQ
ncbi:MAG: class I SAM-dependent methyltransferase [Vampirovibrionia bacterium]